MDAPADDHCANCALLRQEVCLLREKLTAIEAELAKARKNPTNSSKPLALEGMSDAADAIPLLEALQNEDGAPMWVSVHVPRVLESLR